jgi:hypothetical protein
MDREYYMSRLSERVKLKLDQQIRQLSSQEYATTCCQWAHALKLVDPSIILISCGQTGLDEWDNVVLQNVIDKVQLHRSVLYVSLDDSNSKGCQI